MAKDDNKKYWWIKLETKFFNQNQIDYLMAQENGSKYVLLYQMLCLLTANNNGELTYEIGNMSVKYDIEKIKRDTKYFDHDTIVIALELYLKLGLIQEIDGVYSISNHQEMIGSRTYGAQRKFVERQKNKITADKLGTNVPKSIEYRVKNKDLKKKKEIKEKKSTLIPPTINQIRDYCFSRNNNVNPKQFYDFYNENGWKDSIGRQVKNWKQKIIYWENQRDDQKRNRINDDIMGVVEL